MRRSVGLRLSVLAAMCAAAPQAHAQGDAAAMTAPADAPAAPAGSTPAAEPAPEAPAPEAEAAPVAAVEGDMQPSAAPSSRAACLFGGATGVPEADSMTAAGLVCEALLQAGANIDATPTPADAVQSGSGYRVTMHPLGKLLLLKVTFESPIGTVIDSKTMQLAKIEEVPVAAPRVAEAFVNHKPIADTAKMNTLVGEETRSYQKKQGELSIGGGVFGFGAFNSDVVAGYGIYGQLFYEVLRYGVGAELRVGGSSFDSGEASMTSISLSGRYFFSDGDITPFVGGGFGVLWFSDRGDTSDPTPTTGQIYQNYYYDDFQPFEGSGLAAHGDVGVEFLRMHDVRFAAHLRVDVPMFTLKEMGNASYDRYVLPVSLMGSFSFE